MTERIRLDDFLPFRLVFTANLVSETIARTYRALFGLTIPEWRVIAHVAGGEPMTQQDVVSRSRMDKVTVSRATVALVHRGLIAREPHSLDRRAKLLVLTEAGERLYGKIAPKALELEKAVFGVLSETEERQFRVLLGRVEDAALSAEKAREGL